MERPVPIAQLRLHSGALSALAWLPSLQSVATAGEDGCLRLVALRDLAQAGLGARSAHGKTPRTLRQHDLT